MRKVDSGGMMSMREEDEGVQKKVSNPASSVDGRTDSRAVNVIPEQWLTGAVHCATHTSHIIGRRYD